MIVKTQITNQSTSPAIRERQIKMKYHSTPISLEKSLRLNIANLRKDVGSRSSHLLLVGHRLGQPFQEATWQYLGMFRMCVLDYPAILLPSTNPAEFKDALHCCLWQQEEVIHFFMQYKFMQTQTMKIFLFLQIFQTKSLS